MLKTVSRYTVFRFERKQHVVAQRIIMILVALRLKSNNRTNLNKRTREKKRATEMPGTGSILLSISFLLFAFDRFILRGKCRLLWPNLTLQHSFFFFSCFFCMRCTGFFAIHQSQSHRDIDEHTNTKYRITFFKILFAKQLSYMTVNFHWNSHENRTWSKLSHQTSKFQVSF